MAKFGTLMRAELDGMLADDEAARKQMRALQVRREFCAVMEAVYASSAQAFLDHVNEVYIIREDGGKRLIAYVDESLFAAELNAQRELIKLRFLDMFGEDLAVFDIYVSRGKYKKRHPFAENSASPGPDSTQARANAAPDRELTESELEIVERSVAGIADPRLAKAMRKAAIASLKWQDGKNNE